MPWAFIISLAVAAIFIFGLRNLPLGTIASMAALPLTSWLTNEPLALTLGSLGMFLLVVIRRLTAPKTSLTTSVSTGELLINRLLLDRDIKDKKAWIYREPAEKEKRGAPPK